MWVNWTLKIYLPSHVPMLSVQGAISSLNFSFAVGLWVVYSILSVVIRIWDYGMCKWKQ